MVSYSAIRSGRAAPEARAPAAQLRNLSEANAFSIKAKDAER